MPFNPRQGGLRLKLIAGFFIPLAVIWLIIALLSLIALHGSPYQGLILALLAASLVIPLVTGLAALKKVVRPLAELAQAAQQVAQGQYGLTVTVDADLNHPGGDEINELARQFNHMSLQLEKAYADLEQAAAARTCELESLHAVAAVVSRGGSETHPH